MNQLRTKYLLALLLFLGAISTSSAQTLTITSSNTSFTVNSAAQVETSNTTNTSSFSLNINSLAKQYSLFAAVTSKSFNPSGTVFSSIPFKLSLRSITGVTNTSGAVTGTIPLVESPSYSNLANNATKTGANNTAIWTYDLTLSSIGYSIAPGTYVFTVTIQYNDGTNNSPINRTFDITLLVQNITSLALTQNTTPNFNFSTPAQFTNGITLSNASTFTIKSNKIWTFTANSSTANFTNSGQYSTTMPASILSLKVGSTQSTLSTTPQQLTTGSSTAGSSFDMSYSANVGYTYGPGNYTITITYTLTAQ